MNKWLCMPLRDPFSTLQFPLSLTETQIFTLFVQQAHPSLQLHTKPLTNQNRVCVSQTQLDLETLRKCERVPQQMLEQLVKGSHRQWKGMKIFF